tara:strand:- start:1119 stop:2111 length:993 start_codon:yes stop_codon:yes gene_type:complete
MSFVDSKYIGLVSSRLVKFAKKKEGLYNFRCPYCGDSQKQKNKARGYIYKLKNDHNFKCHNCGVSRTFTNFLKDMDTVLYDQYIMERYKNGLTGRGSQTRNPELKFDKPSFAKKAFDLQRISQLNKEHLARKYLEDRKIPEEYFRDLYYCEKFKEWTNTQKHTFDTVGKDEPRIIIPLINEGKIIGFQGRSLQKQSKIKYITIMLEEDAPKIYGLDKIKKGEKIYVTEGPFDSTFIPNSIALCGADGDISKWVTGNTVWIYDNEPRNREIVQRISNTITRGNSVVIWPKDIQEKDINDMVLSGLNVQSVIESNIFSGLEAKLKFSTWKKV